jgi:hypothetical protein
MVILPEVADADTIGFSCKRTGVNNPRTYYYVIDLSNSTLSRAQSVDMPASTAPAKITPSSVDWRVGPTESGHLDRQTGMMTLYLMDYAMSFACQRTGGI